MKFPDCTKSFLGNVQYIIFILSTNVSTTVQFLYNESLESINYSEINKSFEEFCLSVNITDRAEDSQSCQTSQLLCSLLSQHVSRQTPRNRIFTETFDKYLFSTGTQSCDI